MLTLVFFSKFVVGLEGINFSCILKSNNNSKNKHVSQATQVGATNLINLFITLPSIELHQRITWNCITVIDLITAHAHLRAYPPLCENSNLTIIKI